MATMTEEEKRTRRLAQLSSDASGGKGATRWISDPSSVAISNVPRNQNKNASVGLNTKKRKLKDIEPSKQNQPKQTQPQGGMLYTLGRTGRQFAGGIANKGEQLYEGITGGIEDVYRGATGKPPEKRSLSSMPDPQTRTTSGPYEQAPSIPSMGEDQAVKELAPQLSHMGNDDQARLLAQAYMMGDEINNRPTRKLNTERWNQQSDMPVEQAQAVMDQGRQSTDVPQGMNVLFTDERWGDRQGQSMGINGQGRNASIATKDAAGNVISNRNDGDITRMDVSKMTAKDLGQGSKPDRQLRQVDPTRGYSGYSYSKDTDQVEFPDGRYTLDNGLEVTFGAEGEDRLTQEQRRAVMRQPTRPTRRMSGLSEPEPQDPTAGMSVREKLAYNRNKNRLEVQRLRNEGSLGAVELRNEGDLDVTELQNEGSLVEQRLKNKLENQGVNNLTPNQRTKYINEFDKQWTEALKPGSAASMQSTNFTDSELSTPINTKMRLYRDLPGTAVGLFGYPDKQTKAKLDVNASPTQWQAYVNADAKGKQRILNAIIERRGY